MVARDHASPHYFAEAAHLMIDGNHRLDWWQNTPENERPKSFQCIVFRGSVDVCTQNKQNVFILLCI